MEVSGRTYRKLGLIVGVVGTALLTHAILSPAHIVIREVPPSHLVQLRAGDMEFGRQQVDQMMADRKKMRNCVDKNDVIYNWAVRQFAGEAAGQRIYWITGSFAEFPPECLGYNQAPTNTSQGHITIREKYQSGPDNQQKLSGESLWSCAVFELYNISFDKDDAARDAAAWSGNMSREEYVTAIERREFKAQQRTVEFYRAVWKPYCQDKGLSTDGDYWYDSLPNSYEEWKSQRNGPSYYPYNLYGNFYDRNIIPYLRRTGKLKS